MKDTPYGSIKDDWEIETLKDLCVPGGIQTGPFGSQLHQKDYLPIGTPIITVEHLGENRILHQDLPRISDADKDRLSRYIMHNGDIIFSRVGSVDRRALVRDDENGWLFSGRCLRVRPDKSRIDPEFLSWFFGLEIFKDYIRRIAVGATMPSLNTELLSNVPVIVPSIPEQNAIAGILSALDDKIELNRRMNATLEAMARAVFRQWFVGANDIGDWKESSLEEIFGKKRDCVLTGPFGSHLHAHDYREEGTPLILVKHVVDGHILEDRLPLVGDHKLREMKRYILEVGDIVFTRVGAVGRSAYIHPRHQGWLISGQTLRVRVPDKKKLNPRFLAQIYLEQSFIEMVEQNALGTTRPSLNTSILSSFKFVLPPIELQNRFAEFAEGLDNKVQQNLDESRTLASLRDSLLPKLMRGEMQVKDVEERI